MIVLSHTGETAYARAARARALGLGAETLSLTAAGVGWPEAIEIAEKERSETYTRSYTAALAVLALIAGELGAEGLGPEAVVAAADAAEAALAEPELDDVPEPERLLVIAGAGPEAVTAREGALKLREAARLAAEGYDAEYLLHGSAVPLDRRDALLLLGHDEDGLLGGIGDAARAEGVAVAALESDGAADPLMAQIPLTVRLQLLALRRAEAGGHDPDTVITGAWAAEALWDAGSALAHGLEGIARARANTHCVWSQRPRSSPSRTRRGVSRRRPPPSTSRLRSWSGAHRVLCVDLDPQGNLTMSQGIDPDALELSMYDVLVHKVSIREVIRKREVDVACASIDLAGAEIAMSTMIGRERALKKALAPILEDYDFIFIDTPPSLGLLTINALTASHKVIVPVQCEYLSMRGLIQLQNTLSMVREELNPEIEIEGILPTLVDNRTVHAKEAIEILEENFGNRVFASRINKTVRFAEAPVKGMSVLKYDPDGKAAYAYRQLAEEVLANGKR